MSEPLTQDERDGMRAWAVADIGGTFRTAFVRATGHHTIRTCSRSSPPRRGNQVATNAQVRAYVRRMNELADECDRLRDRLASVVEILAPYGALHDGACKCSICLALAAAKGGL
jgi:hypothetical protein